MSIALVTNIGTALGANGGTTGNIDTTGASLIVVSLGFQEGTTPTVSDNKSNTVTPLTEQPTNTGGSVRLYYFQNPTVGSGHNFIVSGSGTFCAICVAAFSGTATASVFDSQQNGAVNNGAVLTLATGSITPANSNSVVVSGMAGQTPTAVDSGMTTTDLIAFSAGNNYGCGLAYLVQTSASAINPTWTQVTVDTISAAIASFKVASGGGATNRERRSGVDLGTRIGSRQVLF